MARAGLAGTLHLKLRAGGCGGEYAVCVKEQSAAAAYVSWTAFRPAAERGRLADAVEAKILWSIPGCGGVADRGERCEIIVAGPGGPGIYIQAGRRVSSGSWKMLGANQAGAAMWWATVWKELLRRRSGWIRQKNDLVWLH